MNTLLKIGSLLVLSLSISGSATAGAYEDNMAKCLSKGGNPHDAAMVILECTADAGKLGACKVLENNQPGKGFEKAASCMAETLPMGAKTGTVKVPIRFPGGA